MGTDQMVLLDVGRLDRDDKGLLRQVKHVLNVVPIEVRLCDPAGGPVLVIGDNRLDACIPVPAVPALAPRPLEVLGLLVKGPLQVASLVSEHLAEFPPDAVLGRRSPSSAPLESVELFREYLLGIRPPGVEFGLPFLPCGIVVRKDRPPGVLADVD